MAEPAPSHSTNGIAVAGFVLGLCGLVLFWLPLIGQILWILGLIFSGVGFARARKTAGRPQFGLAVAGLSVSAAAAVISILALIGLAGSATGA